MSIVIFIIILAVLIIVHEYGHFIVAKKGGIRVDEFGLGYPPRAKTLFKRKGTLFTLNWLPFGGFVKIFGENPDDESLNGEFKANAFVNKPKWLQALVLFAGPFMNFLFAWIIILVSLWIGLPTSLNETMNPNFIKDKSTIVTNVLTDSPAYNSGITTGDVIVDIKVDGVSNTLNDSSDLRNIVKEKQNSEFEIIYSRAGENFTIKIKPDYFNNNEEKLLGLGVTNFGIYKPNFITGFLDSFKFTGVMISSITLALFDLIKGLFVGGADISSLTGPIGIVSMVGDASKMGIVYILSFTAIISINLGVINLIPFPALDGGRLFFLLIEKIKGGRVNSNFLNWVNFVGFSLLIILMIYVSYKDILRLV